MQVVNLYKTAVMKAEADSIAPALEPQKPSAEVLMEQEEMGSLFPTECRYSEALVCCCRHIQFSSATLLPCAPDPSLFCLPGRWTWRGGSSLGV